MPAPIDFSVITSILETSSIVQALFYVVGALCAVEIVRMGSALILDAINGLDIGFDSRGFYNKQHYRGNARDYESDADYDRWCQVQDSGRR